MDGILFELFGIRPLAEELKRLFESFNDGFAVVVVVDARLRVRGALVVALLTVALALFVCGLARVLAAVGLCGTTSSTGSPSCPSGLITGGLLMKDGNLAFGFW